MMEEKINFVKWLGQKKSLFLKEGLFAIIFFVTFALYHLPPYCDFLSGVALLCYRDAFSCMGLQKVCSKA